MKPVFRIVIATFTGLVLGLAIQRFQEPWPSSGQRVAEVPPVNAVPKEAPTAWSQWLDDTVPLQVLPTAEDFWNQMPSQGTRTQAEWDLAMDEGFFAMPPEGFFAVLSDRRFARFPHLYEAEMPASWSRKLLSLGLEEALKMSGGMPTEALNQHLEHKLLEVLAKENPEGGFDRIKRNGSQDPNQIMDYLKAVAQHRPDKLAGIFGKIEGGSHRQWYAGTLLSGLAAKDWRQAEAWGKKNLTGEEWKKAAGSLFNGFKGNRLAELKKIGDECTDPDLRSSAYSRWVFWPVAGCVETLDRALSLPAGSLNREGWREVAETCSYDNRRSSDPGVGEQELRQLFQKVPEEVRSDFQKTVLKSLVANEWPMAARFYEDLQPDSVSELSERWTEEDPAAASAWLATLPASDKREAAVVAFCQEAAALDPAGAAAWALTISEPAQRETALTRALAAWRQADPAAAAAWAETKGVAGPVGR